MVESTAAIIERLVESIAAFNGIHCKVRMFKVFVVESNAHSKIG